MKNALLCAVIAFGCLLAASGCANDPEEKTTPVADLPLPSVDSYEPDLIGTQGTTIDGDYFPFTAGNRWDFSGTENISGYEITTYPGAGGQDSVPISLNGSNMNYISFFEILPSRMITLSSGQYDLNPIKGYVQNTSQGYTSYSVDTASFYEKTGGSVYCRAKRTGSGDIIEITGRLLLKQPLSVGSTWQTSPQVNIDDMADMLVSSFEQKFGSDAAVTVDSMIIETKAVVVGAENTTVFGQATPAVRVDEAQAGKISISIAGEIEETSVELSACCIFSGVYKWYFVRDTGWVSYTDSTETTTLMNITAEGVTVSDKTFEKEVGEFQVEAITLVPGAGKELVRRSDAQPSQFKFDILSSLPDKIAGKLYKSLNRIIK